MKRAARLVAVLGAAAIAACFSKPSAPHADDGGLPDPDALRDGPLIDAGGDATPDARPIDAQPSCVEDNFNIPTVMNCETWGNAGGTSGFVRLGGRLGMTFTMTNQMGSCTTKMPFDITHGTSIQIFQMPPNGPASFALMTAGTTTTITIERPSNMYGVHLYCGGTDVLNPSASGTYPGWLQLTVAPQGTNMIDVTAWTSSNGTSWNVLSTCNYLVGTVSTVGNVMFTANSGSGMGSALFDEFNTMNCP